MNTICNTVPKKWMNTKEIANYIGYSTESIHKFVQQDILQLNVHYYKKRNKLIFDVKEVDRWIKEDSTIDSNLVNTMLNKLK